MLLHFWWKQAQRRARIHKLRLEKGAAKAAEELEKCDESYLVNNFLSFCGFMSLGCFSYICFSADDPHNDPNVSGDPYKTLFVARLVSYNFHCSLNVALPMSTVPVNYHIWLLLTFPELRDHWEQNQKGVWVIWSNQTGRYFWVLPKEFGKSFLHVRFYIYFPTC